MTDDRPTIEDLLDLVVRMEKVGWHSNGFQMERAGHFALIGPDGTIRLTGAGESPADLDKILEPLPGDGKWKHDA